MTKSRPFSGAIKTNERSIHVPKHFAVILLVILPFLFGCKEEAPVEQIRILGNPTTSAVVGSELRFELGIDGGEGPYQFTLSNQPGWLAVEYNDNPLRPGVIIRGVPAVTGGQTLEDLISTVYRNILLTASDGRSVGTREFEIAVSENALEILKSSLQEAEQMDRPAREVFNTDTRGFDSVPIAMCWIDDAGQPLITEEDLAYWLGLVADLETLEEGGSLGEAEQAELTAVFGVSRPRIAFLNLQIEQALVADSRFHFAISDTAGDMTAGQDYLTSIRRANGETLDLTSGLLAIPSGETLCPIPVFINDDREAEDKESVIVEIENLSDHKFLAASTTEGLEVTDNEPTPAFVTAVGSVTEAAVQAGFNSDTQPPGTVFRMTVKMNDVPLQDQTADHVVTGRLVFSNALGSGVFATVEGPEEVSGSSADVVADTSPEYLAPIENGVEVSFYQETREADGETRTEWISERELYFYAPAQEPSGSIVDDFVTLTWERSSTSFENEETHVIRVNEWKDTVTRTLPLASRAVRVRSGLDGGVYVGYEFEEEGVTVAEIVHYDRLGQATVTLPLRYPGQSIELVDFVVRENGTLPSPLSNVDVLQDVFVVLNVNALLAPPAQPDGTSTLGGQDFLVGFYRRINRIGDFDLLWNRQLGSIWDDTAEALYLSRVDTLVVTGRTAGDLGGFINLGGTDAFMLLLDESGVVLNSRLYGTGGDDAFFDVVGDGSVNFFFAGYTGGETELGASGGGLDILTASFSDDFNVRRLNQFGGTGDQLFNTADNLRTGFFTAGVFDQVTPGVSGSQKDILIAYQRSASALDSIAELGTSGDDVVNEVAGVDFQGIAAGSTGGSLFEGSVHGGGTDWWMASYNVVQPDPTDNDRVLEMAWQIQGGDSRNEAIKSLSATTYGKLFKLTEVEDGNSRIVQVTPFALTDGRELSELP